MAKKLDELYVDITTRTDKLKSGIKGATSTMLGFGKAVAIPAAAAAAALIKIGDDFDKAMRTIQVGTGATGKTLQTLKADFENVFKNVPDSAAKVADVIATLNTATGATGDTLQTLSERVLDASRILGEDASANAAKFGQVLNQFNVPAAEGADLMDKLFKLTQDYGISLGDITGQLKTYGAVMKNAGFSVDETAVLMAKMNKAGIDWSRVAPGLNKSFRDMAKNGVDSKKGLTAAVKAIRETEDATDALALSTQIFGAEGAQRMLTAIKNNTFSLNDLDSALKGSTGLIESTEQSTRTLGEEFAIVKNELFLLIEPLARAFVDALKNGIQWLGDFIDTLKLISAQAKILYEDIKTYLIDKFEEIVQGVKQKIEAVKSFFSDLYHAVVGGSYIPDMVNKIYVWMSEKLKAALVDNAEENTTAADELFNNFYEGIKDAAIWAVSDISGAFADAATDWIFHGENFFTSFKEGMLDMAEHFINQVIRMAVEYAAFQALLATGIVAPGTLGLAAAGGAASAGTAAGAGGAAAGLSGAGMGLSIGGGALGGYAIGKAFGTSGTGGAIGGGIGSGIGFAVGGPVGAVIGGAMGGVAGTVLEGAGKEIGSSIKNGAKNLKFWADGGLVMGPTLGVAGEAGPEAVIPLDRLDSMIGAKQQTIIVNLDGRQIARTSVKHMPSVLRLQGVGI